MMHTALDQVYSSATVEEWMETHLLPDFRKVSWIIETARVQGMIGARIKDYQFPEKH